jgi:hypothetical protein
MRRIILLAAMLVAFINSQAGIEEQLDSLFAQRYGAIDILVAQTWLAESKSVKALCLI